MKKIYLSGQITGLSFSQARENFLVAEKEVKELGYEAVSPLDLPHMHKQNWVAFMREDLKAMLDCDAVYCLVNWRESKGARIEIELALQLGLTIIHQQHG